MPKTCLKVTVLAAQISASALAGAAAQSDHELPEVKVSASADASAQGLSPNHAGDQVARGARVGLLGNKDAMDTPFSTTAYTSSLIADQQARSVADVLLNDATVRASRGFGNFQELYMVRGFPVPSDDMTFNGLYGVLPRQYLAAEMMERVEVLRGPTSVLNGGVGAVSGFGLGGTINVLPKRADNEDLNRVTLSTEHGGHLGAAADMSRRFGPDRKSGVRLNAVHRDGEASVDGEKRQLTLLNLGLDHRERDLRLSADLGHQDHQLTQPRPSVTPSGGIPAVPDASTNHGQAWTYAKDSSLFLAARAEYDVNQAVTGWLAYGLRQGHEDNRLANPTATASGASSQGRFDNVRKDDVQTAEVGVRSKRQTGGVAHAVALTATVFDLKSRNAWGYAGASPSGSLSQPADLLMPAFTLQSGNLDDPKLTQRTLTRSVALTDTLSVMGDRLQLTLGLRHQSLDDRSFNGNTGALDASSVYEKSRVSPLAAIVWRMSPAWSVYANHTEGLTKGDTASATNNSLPVSNAGAKLAPYVAKQQEIGLKFDGRQLGASVAVFRTAKPLGMYDDSNTFVSGGEQRNTGLELSTFGVLTPDIKVLGGVTLLDANIVKSNQGSLDGKNAIGVPHQQFNVGAEWAVKGVAGLSLDARYIQTGSQYANAANSWSIPAWHRLDLGARYVATVSGKLLTLRARVDNVENRSYWASVGGYPGSSYLVQGAPRTVSVSGSVDF